MTTETGRKEIAGNPHDVLQNASSNPKPDSNPAVPDNFESVSTERWKTAQHWERSHWVNTQRARAKYGKNFIWRVLTRLGLRSKYRGDDWNEWWKSRFDGYGFLPRRISNALEVGCGPYTNVRLMLDHTSFDHLFLSDPLIRTYVGFKLTFVSEMYRRAACILDDHPLEELPFASSYFDLTVMINVLDNVRDAHACMNQLIRVIRPGGWLVLGQDLTDDQDVARQRGTEGEIGHPIKLRHEWFNPWLDSGAFDIHQHRILSRAEGRSPEGHYGTLLFAGRNRA